MSDLNLLPEQETSEELLEKLVDSLPTSFPKDESKNNYSIYGPIATQENNLVKDIHKVRKAKEVKNAETFDQLVEIAKFVDVYPRSGEGLEKYRFRVFSTFKNLTNEGTIADLLEFTGYIFNVPVSSFTYQEDIEPGLIEIGLQKSVVDNSPLGTEEIKNLLEDNISAGKRLRSIVTGTFEYISVSDSISNLDNSSVGYATIDVDGNVVGNNGTYSGLL